MNILPAVQRATFRLLQKKNCALLNAVFMRKKRCNKTMIDYKKNIPVTSCLKYTVQLWSSHLSCNITEVEYIHQRTARITSTFRNKNQQTDWKKNSRIWKKLTWFAEILKKKSYKHWWNCTKEKQWNKTQNIKYWYCNVFLHRTS